MPLENTIWNTTKWFDVQNNSSAERYSPEEAMPWKGTKQKFIPVWHKSHMLDDYQIINIQKSSGFRT